MENFNNVEDISNRKQISLEAAEEYKKEQVLRINSFKVGEKDPLGYEIKSILTRGDEYVVYEIKNVPSQESIRVVIDSILETDLDLLSRFNKTKSYLDEFMSLYAKYECDVSYKKRAANAIAMGISGDLEAAKPLFNKIKEDILKDHSDKIYGKLSYQAGALFISAMLLTASLLFYIFRATNFVENNRFLFQLMIATTFAALGGFLSISIKIKELTIDKGLKKRVYFAYGIERMIISIIGGVFV